MIPTPAKIIINLAKAAKLVVIVVVVVPNDKYSMGWGKLLYYSLLVWIAYAFRVVQADNSNNPQHDSEKSPFFCDILLAPSKEFGWGVYAGRNFIKGDIVEIVPAYLFLPSKGVEIQSSILYDYVHTRGCTSSSRGDDDDDVDDDDIELDQLLLGCGSSYNHHHSTPNVMFVELEQPAKGHVMTVQATRNISQGEELLARYGDNDWFTSRGIIQNTDKKSGVVIISEMDMPRYQALYCSKIHAVIGKETWNEKIVPSMSSISVPFSYDPHQQRLANKDAGYGFARAKCNLQPNDRIELSLGLLVSQRIMSDSVIAPFLFQWQDLNMQQQRTVRNLRKTYRDQFVLHYPGREERHDSFESYEDLGILPIGALAMVRRRGANAEDSNCRLKIRGSMQPGSSSIGLELIATKPIREGQVLLLDMPPAGTASELELLRKGLKRTGQPYHASIFAKSDHDEL